jgi:hypothetical protein
VDVKFCYQSVPLMNGMSVALLIDERLAVESILEALTH